MLNLTIMWITIIHCFCVQHVYYIYEFFLIVL